MHQWPFVTLILQDSDFVVTRADGTTFTEDGEEPNVYISNGECEPVAYTNCADTDFEALVIELKLTLP